MNSIACLLCMMIAALVVSSIGAYNIRQQHNTKSLQTQCQQHDRPTVSRQSFLTIVAGGLTAGVVGTMDDRNGVQQRRGMNLLFPSPVWAKDGVKGTKDDPAFQACLSKCIYDCTKPKGSEQKSRSECLPDCKQQCATTKAQLLRGEPINKDGPS